MEMKRWRFVTLLSLALVAVAAAAAEQPAGPVEPVATPAPAPAPAPAALVGRAPRAARKGSASPGSAAAADSCRYSRAAWTECDPATNMRTRTLTLKKGDANVCERTKIIQKKCKKACRYEKASWSPCGASGEQTRIDVLRAGSDATCEPRRTLTRKCARTHQKPSKDKGPGRRNRQ